MLIPNVQEEIDFPLPYDEKGALHPCENLCRITPRKPFVQHSTIDASHVSHVSHFTATRYGLAPTPPSSVYRIEAGEIAHDSTKYRIPRQPTANSQPNTAQHTHTPEAGFLQRAAPVVVGLTGR